MAEHNVNTVKAQIQSLINKANETTGNTDTNLTDGVNALVSGYGQGGIQLPDDMLEGLENGYDVMFYDENNIGVAFYSIQRERSIYAPVYDCKAWQTADGVDISFPYTPTSDVILYARNSTYASKLYNYYGIDSTEYPYLAIQHTTSTLLIAFGTTVSGTKITGLKSSCSASDIDKTDIELVTTKVMELIAPNSLTATTEFVLQNASKYTYYTNYDVGYSISKQYRLDE